jgi:hypothetical protein
VEEKEPADLQYYGLNDMWNRRALYRGRIVSVNGNRSDSFSTGWNGLPILQTGEGWNHTQNRSFCLLSGNLTFDI